MLQMPNWTRANVIRCILHATCAPCKNGHLYLTCRLQCIALDMISLHTILPEHCLILLCSCLW